MRRSVLSRHYTRTRAALHRSAAPNQRTPILSGFFSQGAPSPIENRQSLRYLLLHPNRKAADLANKSKPYDTRGGEKNVPPMIFSKRSSSLAMSSRRIHHPHGRSRRKRKKTQRLYRVTVCRKLPKAACPRKPRRFAGKAPLCMAYASVSNFPQETLIPVPRLWPSETQCLYRVTACRKLPKAACPRKPRQFAGKAPLCMAYASVSNFPQETLIPVPRLWPSETQCLYRVSLSKAPQCRLRTQTPPVRGQSAIVHGLNAVCLDEQCPARCGVSQRLRRVCRSSVSRQ